MGLFKALRDELTSTSATSNRTDTPSQTRTGRNASQVENLTRDGSTVRKVRGSYVVTRPTGGVHRHDPNSNGTYSCACGC